jgi:hypothetical protein
MYGVGSGYSDKHSRQEKPHPVSGVIVPEDLHLLGAAGQEDVTRVRDLHVG